MTRSGVRSSLAPPLDRQEKAGKPAFFFAFASPGNSCRCAETPGAIPDAGSAPQGDGCPVPQPDATDDRNGVIESLPLPRGPLQPATGRRSLCSLPPCLVGTGLRPAVRALPANVP